MKSLLAIVFLHYAIFGKYIAIYACSRRVGEGFNDLRKDGSVVQRLSRWERWQWRSAQYIGMIMLLVVVSVDKVSWREIAFYILVFSLLFGPIMYFSQMADARRRQGDRRAESPLRFFRQDGFTDEGNKYRRKYLLAAIIAISAMVLVVILAMLTATR